MPRFSSALLCLATIAGLLSLGSWTGCVSEPKARSRAAPAPAPASVGNARIQEIDLLALPVALNLDQIPGPDGFIIKVFAGNRKQPKPIAIEEGTLEVLMFDGVLGITSPGPAKPKRVWTYSAEQLKNYEIHSSVGIGYQLAPVWGDAKPSGNKITVGVRYTAPDGKVLTSAPSVISVAM